jgi:hypothetical protein
MAFQANVLKVMIASPGDVESERDLVTDELYRWNNANAVSRELMLQPVKWETHSSPEMGAHPQTLINQNLLKDADIVVGIFGTRIGTATPDFISGSVEEIKRHVAAGKLAMLYFSRVPVDPHAIDQKQWAALQAFKTECQQGGLYAEYESHESLKAQVGQHLTIELNKPKYLWMARPRVTGEPRDRELTDDEIRLLTAAAYDPYGQVLATTDLSGFSVQSNGKSFVEDSARSSAMWKRAIKRLTQLGYLDKRSEFIYELTDEGFARADKETANAPLEISVSISGPPQEQKLSVNSSKPVTITQVELMLSSGACIAKMDLREPIESEGMIPLDNSKLVELFNAPRPDMHHYDRSGPAALRISVESRGRLIDVELPVLLTAVIQNSTQWVKATGSKRFTF